MSRSLLESAFGDKSRESEGARTGQKEGLGCDVVKTKASADPTRELWSQADPSESLHWRQEGQVFEPHMKG